MCVLKACFIAYDNDLRYLIKLKFVNTWARVYCFYMASEPNLKLMKLIFFLIKPQFNSNYILIATGALVTYRGLKKCIKSLVNIF